MGYVLSSAGANAMYLPGNVVLWAYFPYGLGIGIEHRRGIYIPGLNYNGQGHSYGREDDKQEHVGGRELHYGEGNKGRWWWVVGIEARIYKKRQEHTVCLYVIFYLSGDHSVGNLWSAKKELRRRSRNSQSEVAILHWAYYHRTTFLQLNIITFLLPFPNTFISSEL